MVAEKNINLYSIKKKDVIKNLFIQRKYIYFGYFYIENLGIFI